MMRIRLAALPAVALAVLGLAAPLHAQLDLGVPNQYGGYTSGIGYAGVDRNLVFEALQGYSLTSAGVWIQPGLGQTTWLVASLYSMADPSADARTLITTGQATLADVGEGFYDVPIFASLAAGQYYDIGFYPFSSPDGWGVDGEYTMQLYTFDPLRGYWYAPYSPGGVVTVLDGGYGSGDAPGIGNYAMPHLRLDGVAGTVATSTPEPASLTLLATGLVSLAGIARRKRRSRDGLAGTATSRARPRGDRAPGLRVIGTTSAEMRDSAPSGEISMRVARDRRCIVGDMGVFDTTVSVENLARRGVRREVAHVMVDTGSEFTWLPRDVLESLGIVIEERQRFLVADGRVLERDVGYALLRTAGRAGPDFVVFAEPDDMILLGAHTMEGLNLRVEPRTKRLVSAGPIVTGVA